MDTHTLKKLDEIKEKLDREECCKKDSNQEKKARERADAKVCGGIFRPKPVDKAAAMLLAKASWISKPPKELKPNVDEKEKGSKMTTKPPSDKTVGKAASLIIPAMEIMNECTPADAMKAYENMQEKFLEANKALAQASFGFRTEMERLNAVASEALESIRGKRYALVTETSNAMAALREVRQFFIGADYEIERKRLAEFVDLCERLQALKTSGFLDRIGDTMLKLAVGD